MSAAEPAELSGTDLTQRLCDAGVVGPDDRIVEVDREPIGNGLMARCLRAELRWEGTGPASVIVKLPSADPGSLAMATALRMYEVEVGFYRDLAPRLPGLHMPRAFAAEYDSATGGFLLVIEDLRDHRPGDALAGMTRAEVEATLAQLANLQAPLWNSPTLRLIDWLADDARVHGFFDMLAMSVEPFLSRFGDRLEDDHVKLFETVVPRAGDWARSWASPLVLQHGDFRADNLLWSPTGVPAVLDFQTARLGPPGVDLAYLLASALPPAERRAAERDLVDAHATALTAAGVPDFDTDAAWNSYREGALYGAILFAGGAGQVESNERNDRMIATQAALFAQMAIDLDSVHVAGLA